MRKKITSLILVLVGSLFILLLVQGWLNKKIVDKKVSVKYADTENAKTLAEKLPQGFHPEIPVEDTYFTESYSTYYSDSGIRLSHVSYGSEKSVEENYKKFLDYMAKNSFDFGESGKDKANNSLYGARGGQTLSVVVRSAGEGSVVQITYTEKTK